MKYNTIEINREFESPKKWSVVYYPEPIEKEGLKSKPIPESGVYDFPLTISKRVAFDKLKEAMVKSYRREIEKMSKELNALLRLKLPNDLK